MRDYSSSQGAWSYQVLKDPPAPCGNNTVITAQGADFLASERARADLKQGNHFTATGYSAYRRSVEPAVMDYVEDRWRRIRCSGAYHWYSHRYVGTRYPTVRWMQLVSTGSVHLPIVSANVVGRARNNALSKLASSDVDLGQTFGEALSTSHTMGNLIAKGARACLYAINRNWSKAAKELGYVPGELDSSFAGQFLAFKFGIRPVMNDLYNMHDSIQEVFNSDDSMLRVVAVARDAKAPYWVGNSHVAGSMENGCEVGISYKINDQTLSGLNAMGLINPFALAWELLPMSFIIDWFISVGNYLDGLSAGIGLTFKSGYQTTFVKTSATVTDHNQSYGIKSGSRPQGIVKEFGMHRTVYADFPSQAVVYNTSLNASQALVIGALLSQIGKLR